MIEKIKKFDNEQLNKLLEDLKDINKFTGFENGAFKFNLGKYQANILINYLQQLENFKSAFEELKTEFPSDEYLPFIIKELETKYNLGGE